MTRKELKRLSRIDLLELLLQQQREVERLEKELAEAKAELESREILLDEAGSIAEAALGLNRIFETAQAAADQYVENVRMLCEEKLEAAK